MTSEALLNEALKLSADEREALAERLLESLECEPHQAQLSDEQEAELDRRLDRLEATGPQGLPWDVVENQIRV